VLPGRRVAQGGPQRVPDIIVISPAVPVRQGACCAADSREVFKGQRRNEQRPDRLVKIRVGSSVAEMIEAPGRLRLGGDGPAGQPLAEENARGFFRPAAQTDSSRLR
jgi:hypothetical protein